LDFLEQNRKPKIFFILNPCFFQTQIYYDFSSLNKLYYGVTMILLLDGYNILKQIYNGQMISEQQRNSFIKQLAAYKRLRSHKKMVVVFAGGPDPWPLEEKIRGISIVYAGASRTADDYIHSFIEKHKSKASNMMLVSSDRQVCSWASEYGVISIDAQEFYKIMQHAIKSPPIKKVQSQAVKTAKVSSPELDVLMQEASAKIEEKKEDLLQERERGREQKLSKKERALLKKLKKL
jgi:predicted RNA-binding protein with PIN domain